MQQWVDIHGHVIHAKLIAKNAESIELELQNGKKRVVQIDRLDEVTQQQLALASPVRFVAQTESYAQLGGSKSPTVSDEMMNEFQEFKMKVRQHTITVEKERTVIEHKQSLKSRHTQCV